MPKYKTINVVFKSSNDELHNWILEESGSGDISRSAFIIRSLKKLKKLLEKRDEEFEV